MSRYGIRLAYMRKCPFRSLWLARLVVLAVFLALCLTFLPARAEQRESKPLTIMVYIVGSDLETEHGSATRDITEMLKARADTSLVNVLVMTGGAGRWHTPLIPADQLSILQISGSRPTTVWTSPHQSMGEAETLATFLDYAYERYPADAFGLILWNHGGGPMVGFGVDIRSQNDQLTLNELRNGLQASRLCQVSKLAWIGFDACLMSTAEVAFIASDFAGYMIASQETLPGEGWNYQFLGDLRADNLDGPAIAACIIDRTMQQYEKIAEKSMVRKDMLTLSCLDLEKSKTLESAINALFSDLDASLALGQYPVIAQSRGTVKSFGVSSTASEFDLIDIMDFAYSVALYYPGPAQAVVSAIEEMVLINETNQPSSCGISMYFPFYNQDYFVREWREEYASLGFAKDYTAFMQTFSAQLLTDGSTEWIGSKSLVPVLDSESNTYYLQLTPQQAANYVKGYYYILSLDEGGHYYLHRMSSDVELDDDLRLTAGFDNRCLLLRNTNEGNDDIAFPVTTETESRDGVEKCRTRVGLYPHKESILGMKPGYMLTEIDRPAGIARIVGLVLDAQGTDPMHGKLDTDLSLWEKISIINRGYFAARDEKGNLLAFSQWQDSGWRWIWDIETGPGFEAFYGNMDELDLDLFCFINMIDVHGNEYTSELMPVSARAPSPARDGAADAPPPLRWEPDVIAFDASGNAEAILVSRDGVTVTLTQVETNNELSLYPENVELMVTIENQNEYDVCVSLEKISINGNSMPDSLQANVAEGIRLESVFKRASKTSGVFSVTNAWLYDAGVERIRNIDFCITIKKTDWSLLYESDAVSLTFSPEVIVPESPPPEAGVRPLTVVREADYHDDVITFQSGKISLDARGNLIVGYVLGNHSYIFDSFEVVNICLNDTMGFYDQTVGYVRSGTKLYGSFQLHADYLRDARVTSPETIEFQIKYSGSGMDTREFTGVTPPLTMVLERVAEKGSLLAEDRVLVDSHGVRVTQLADDPTGKTFLVENATPYRIMLSTAASFKEQYPKAPQVSFYVNNLLPGKSVYCEITGDAANDLRTLPLVQNMLNVVDEDSKTLLFTTEVIRLN